MTITKRKLLYLGHVIWMDACRLLNLWWKCAYGKINKLAKGLTYVRTLLVNLFYENFGFQIPKYLGI